MYDCVLLGGPAYFQGRLLLVSGRANHDLNHHLANIFDFCPSTFRKSNLYIYIYIVQPFLEVVNSKSSPKKMLGSWKMILRDSEDMPGVLGMKSYLSSSKFAPENGWLEYFLVSSWGKMHIFRCFCC